MEMIKMAFKDIIEKFSEIKEKVKLHPERTQKVFLKYTNNIREKCMKTQILQQSKYVNHKL